jgi:acetylornithine/succinyldiaminopimelate/putrescine aminotransferase
LKNEVAKDFVSKLQGIGVLVNATSESVIRIAPPLVVTDFQINNFIESFRKVAQTYER